MISKEEVEHVAHLARIGIKETEVEKYQEDLSAVLDFFRELEKVSLEGKPPETVSGRAGVARTDREEDFAAAGQETIRRNFPDSKGGFLKVKSVF